MKKYLQNFVAEYETLEQTILNVKSNNEKMKTELIMCIAQTKTTIVAPPTLTTRTVTTTSLRNAWDAGWGSFNCHFYLKIYSGVTWDDALAFCESKNSYLVETTTDPALEFVSFHYHDYCAFWLGETDRETRGFLVYQHSRLLVPSKFEDKEQPRSTGYKCAFIFRKKEYSTSCYRQFIVVCEKP